MEMKMAGNAVAPFKFGGLAGLEGLAGGLAQVQQTTKGRSSGPPILRLGRDGVWMFGPENIEPQEGSQWAINPGSIQHGWVAWKRDDDPNAKPELRDEAMVPASMPKPDRNSLTHYADAPWAEQLSCELLCLNGEDEGTTVTFKPSSIGGKEAFLKLIGQITKKAAQGDPKVVPVVTLEQSSYPHKKWGKTYVPVLNVVDWLTGLEGDPGEATATNQRKASASATQTTTQGPAEAAQPARRPAVGQVPVTSAKPATVRKRKPVEPTPLQEGVPTDTSSPIVEQLRAAEADEEPPFVETAPDATVAATPRRRRVAN
jgi:hypothetical protein